MRLLRPVHGRCQRSETINLNKALARILESLKPESIEKVDNLETPRQIAPTNTSGAACASRPDCTSIFEDRCSTVSLSRQGNLRRGLKAEWIYKNPARKLPMPDCKEPDQPYMENEEFLKFCDELPLFKNWLIVNVCRFGGLRTSEVFALKWKNWDGLCFWPSDTVWNGIVQPRKLKRKSARGPVATPAWLRAEI